MDRSSKFRSQSNPSIRDWSVHAVALSRTSRGNTRFMKGGSMISKRHESISNEEEILQC